MYFCWLGAWVATRNKIPSGGGLGPCGSCGRNQIVGQKWRSFKDYGHQRGWPSVLRVGFWCGGVGCFLQVSTAA